MKHSSTTCHPAHNGDALSFDEVTIDFGEGVLMLTHDDRRLVAIEQKAVIVFVLEQVFFGGDIVGGVVAITDDA